MANSSGTDPLPDHSSDKKKNSEKNFKLFSKVTQLLVRVEHMGKAIKCFMDLCVP